MRNVVEMRRNFRRVSVEPLKDAHDVFGSCTAHPEALGKGDCAKPLLEIPIKAIVSREGCNVKLIEYNKIRHL